LLNDVYRQGILAPVLTSGALFGVYALLKYFPDFDLKTILGLYFWILGTFAIAGNVTLPLQRWTALGEAKVNVALPQWLGAYLGCSSVQVSIPE
jgi:hypothetical protein